MPGNEIERNPLIRGRLYKFLNLGLCFVGVIFVIIGVFKSTLLLYIGCAVSQNVWLYLLCTVLVNPSTLSVLNMITIF